MNRIFTLVSAVLLSASLWAQTPPQNFSYQAVVRSENNTLVTKKQVGMKISLLQGSETGTAVYVETHTPTSNENGLVSIAIGGGTKDPSSAAFATIDWSKGYYFVKTETDPTGGTTYSLTTTSQLMSVPYALYAANSQPGTPGADGKDGTNGLNGAPGAPGAKGDAGANGTNGTDGLNGAPGAKGDKGDAGTDGLNGATGDKGDKGDTGADGTNGTPGAKGDKGDAGATGAIGPQGEPGKDGISGTSGQSVLFNPTTPPTNGMVDYKWFQNNNTTNLYDDGKIRIRLNLGTNKLYLTNVNSNLANIWSAVGSLSSSAGSSMSMSTGNGYFQNFGTAAISMGTELNAYSNLTTSNNYVMTMYISSPDSPAFGLYVINFYFNSPTNSLRYSNMTVNYYKDPTATP